MKPLYLSRAITGCYGVGGGYKGHHPMMMKDLKVAQHFQDHEVFVKQPINSEVLNPS